jgi:lipopolysaccharide transport system permease protein
VDFLISLVILAVVMITYQVPLTPNILWIIPFTLLAMTSALAMGLWFSALNVRYRDVQQMVPFIAQLWLYMTPVLYPITINDPTWKFLYSLNPMVGVVTGFRWVLFGKTPPDATIFVSIAAVLLLFVTGLFFFRRMEKTFADVV